MLYSPRIDAVAKPVVNSLNKFGCVMHCLYENMYYQDEIHMKDLKSLNQNLGQVMLINNDPQELGGERMSRI